MRRKQLEATLFSTKVKATWLIAAAVSCVGLGGGCYTARTIQQKHKLETFWDGRAIPAEGLVVDPQGVGAKLNPEGVYDDFHRIYAAMAAYRKKWGKLPKPSELFDFGHELVAGLRLSKQDFQNPDHRYADGYSVRRGDNTFNHYAPLYSLPRADKRAKPTYPSQGEVDVWFECRDYLRNNEIAYQGGRRTAHFAGYYLLLMSDGTIRRIPYRQALLVEIEKGKRREFFPGEPGVPSVTAVPITSVWKDQYGTNATWD